jgi:hypothetical protein
MQIFSSTISLLPLIILTIMIPSSCYPSGNNQTSSNKSLDNFANGGVKKYNVCSANSSSSSLANQIRLSASKPEAKVALEAALSAVPLELLQAFQSAGGQVMSSASAEAMCGKALKTNSEKDLNTGATIPSCWLQEGTGVAPKIIVSDDPVLIHHSIIRAFTYFFVEYFVPRVKNPASGIIARDPRWQTTINDLEAKREKITQAFLTDIRLKNEAMANTFTDSYKKDSVTLSNAVLAEVLDSCYCSDQTRRTFREQFPTTWSAAECRGQ